MTKVGLHALGTSTTLESNKSLWPLTGLHVRKGSSMCKVARGELAPMQRDVSVPVARERERLQERLTKVGQVISAIDHALHRADVMVSPLIDDLRRQEAHPAFAHACRAYEETVAAVTYTRQQLFDLPMLVTLLAQAPPEERVAAFRRMEQHVSELHGIEEALDAAATQVVKAWQAT